MKVVSFNVNSVRVRLPQLEAVIDKHSPEIIGLQETKVPDADFPVDEINALGYKVQYHGQKTHYGVALLSRKEPAATALGFHHDEEDSQRRFIKCSFTLPDQRMLHVINCYFPQGGNRSHETKFPAKQKFYADVYEHIKSVHQPQDLLLLMGDMNVAPVDRDIGIGEQNMKRWLKDGKTSFLPEERAWLQHIKDWGMVDSFRVHHPDVDDVFSWFDYRSRGFERKPRRGLRIDLILASIGLQGASRNAGIDYDIRGMDRPSDHCPIWSELELTL
jgi:exodeoxyribonuclease III